MSRPASLEPAELTGLQAPWALVDARVWTGDGGIAEAIAFGADGRVAGCGTRADVLDVVRAARGEIVDGRGAMVCPGFVDPHIHIRACASARLATDAGDALGAAELVVAVRHAARTHGEWITLVGARVESPLTGRVPDRRELDRASRGAPVRIRDRSGHGWLFNSAALRRLGVAVAAGGERSGLPDGVLVERGHGGLATGFVADHVGWVGARLGRISAEGPLRGAVAEFSRELARRGVAAVCDATATNDTARVDGLLRWRESGALRQEVTFLSSPGAVFSGRARRRHAGVKFAAAADSRLAKALRSGARSGRAVAVHCIEPAETAAVLQVASAIPAPERGPLRIEHAAFLPPDWIDAVHALRATVVTHPSFIHAHGDRYLDDSALEPHDWLYRLNSWTRAGVPVAFASDAPFGPLDPLDALRAAAARRTAAGTMIGLREAMCGEPALHALTTVAARCSGLDRLGYGRLVRGGPGAAVILSDDPRDPGRLPELELVASVIGGDVVA